MTQSSPSKPQRLFSLLIYGIFDTPFSLAKRRVDVEIPPSFG